ncbi:MAG TPA: ATP-binding cassette domain-containing protein [Actinomycetota bacterium]|nr:ATP-binding cassette domain-containing protein [Actinomycetota bacterium]
MTRLPRSAPVPLAATGLALASLAFLVEDVWLVKFSSWLIFGTLALSLAFIWGRGGIFSFGQNAFFGIGAYLYGIAAINLVHSTGETVTAFLIGGLGGALMALILGYFMFYGRLGDVYVAIITLAVTLVLFTVMAGTAGPQYRVGEARLGGYNGMTGIPPIVVGIPFQGDGIRLTPQTMYLFVVVMAVTLFAAVSRLSQQPFGRVVIAVRENELRTELLGYDIRRYKLLAFTFGGAIAGLAGSAFAAWGLFVNPAVFGLRQAALVVIWLLVGGQASLIGPFLGAALVEWISSTLAGGVGGDETPIILGITLVLVVLLLPHGLAGLLRLMWERLTRSTRRAPRVPEGKPGETSPASQKIPSAILTQLLQNARTDAATLEVRGLAKSFGGVQALDDVTLSFPARGIRCLIGPNGAGKSTFFNLLIGRFPPSRGRIYLEGRDITRLHPHRRAQQGIGIKLQVPSLYPGLSVRENVWLASFAVSRNVPDANRRTEEMLGGTGLAHRADELAANLSHGEQQWLEITMVLAAAPRVILLDEPSAGMTREETLRTADIVRGLGEVASVIVVEHDMEFVRHLGAPITMFHQGRIFVEGTLEELRRDQRVLDVYLGRERARRVAVE